METRLLWTRSSGSLCDSSESTYLICKLETVIKGDDWNHCLLCNMLPCKYLTAVYCIKYLPRLSFSAFKTHNPEKQLGYRLWDPCKCQCHFCHLARFTKHIRGQQNYVLYIGLDDKTHPETTTLLKTYLQSNTGAKKPAAFFSPFNLCTIRGIGDAKSNSLAKSMISKCILWSPSGKYSRDLKKETKRKENKTAVWQLATYRLGLLCDTAVEAQPKFAHD